MQRVELPMARDEEPQEQQRARGWQPRPRRHCSSSSHQHCALAEPGGTAPQAIEGVWAWIDCERGAGASLTACERLYRIRSMQSGMGRRPKHDGTFLFLYNPQGHPELSLDPQCMHTGPFCSCPVTYWDFESRGPALIRIHALGTEVRTAGVAGSWARTWARPVSAFYILSFRAGRARARREAGRQHKR